MYFAHESLSLGKVEGFFFFLILNHWNSEHQTGQCSKRENSTEIFVSLLVNFEKSAQRAKRTTIECHHTHLAYRDTIRRRWCSSFRVTKYTFSGIRSTKRAHTKTERKRENGFLSLDDANVESKNWVASRCHLVLRFAAMQINCTWNSVQSEVCKTLYIRFFSCCIFSRLHVASFVCDDVREEPNQRIIFG